MVQTSIVDELADVRLPKINFLLAEIVKYFHFGIVIFTGIGWMFPWPQSLILFIFLVPAMKLHWMTNNNVCFFTTLENRLRRNPHAGSAEQDGFMYRLSVGIFGRHSPSEERVLQISEIGMYLGWIVAVLRLYFS
ncbi:MAG: DUF2784 family protein [Euryarchaeota archaeon]|jgi:hypothetical protein|nr:DUF2784 family protein [Euryarchaeota archaeon]